MNSRASSACYPRRTFYPLSDGPSIQDHRITKAWFPTCSTCKSRSQAPLCFCTRRLVSNQPEGTFARLRYSFGGDRPSQTTRQTVSLSPLQGIKLELQNNQGGISRLAPRPPKGPPQSLPPILRRSTRSSLPRCSKGAQGLSVFPRVDRISTAITISLSR